MRLTENMARMGENRITCKFLVGKPEEKNHLEDLRVDVKIILKLILQKWPPIGLMIPDAV